MNYNPFSLEGKIILVTGASSGIGRATAIECSKMGATVIITGRNEERLNETLSMLSCDKPHKAIIADLNQEDSLISLIDQLPILDGCVNNAGFNIMQLVPFIKSDSVEQIFKTNTKAPILITHYLVKKKKIRKGGSIVFTSSISGMGRGASSLGNSLYSATKGAITSFMRNAALDLGSKRIRCNAALPGMIETPRKEGKAVITEEQWEINRQKYPLGRFGNPEDVAYAIIYLLSDAAIWVTGSELIVDGGRSLN